MSLHMPEIIEDPAALGPQDRTGLGRLSTLQLRSAQVGVAVMFHFRQARCNAFHRLVAG